MTVVQEIMATAVASLRSTDPAHFALAFLKNLGIHAAPVLDRDGHVLGILSQSDLTGELDEIRVTSRMQGPVEAVRPGLDLEGLAIAFAEGSHHHLPVVSADGRLCGMVSVLDLVRCLAGRQPSHPQSFDLHDPWSLLWSEPAWLTPQAPRDVPDSPGFVFVSDPQPDGRDTPIWATSTDSRRAALQALLDSPTESVRVRSHAGPLRFRHAASGEP